MIPKILFKSNLQVITPCYCAGGEQARAELRAASFRGELRWWFRCLGGNRKQEETVFGSIAGNKGRASAVAMLLTGVELPDQSSRWQPEGNPGQGETNSSYITFFLSKQRRKYVPVGTTFRLELRQMRDIEDRTALSLLELAWKCMCNLGAVGSRKTRGLGAYAPLEPQERKVADLLQDTRVNSHFASLMHPDPVGDFNNPAATTAILRLCASQLKEYRRRSNYHPGSRKYGAIKCETVLGSVCGKFRQTSAVRFRPILDQDGRLRLCVLKAPSITLGRIAQKYDIKL